MFKCCPFFRRRIASVAYGDEERRAISVVAEESVEVSRETTIDQPFRSEAFVSRLHLTRASSIVHDEPYSWQVRTAVELEESINPLVLTAIEMEELIQEADKEDEKGEEREEKEMKEENEGNTKKEMDKEKNKGKNEESIKDEPESSSSSPIVICASPPAFFNERLEYGVDSQRFDELSPVNRSVPPRYPTFYAVI